MIRRNGIFFFFFAVSGFSGLIYESIWSHYLKLFLGHAAYAQALVLAVFMAGMALGAWLSGTQFFLKRNVLLGYALVEGIIGIFALFFHNIFDLTARMSYFSVIPHLGSPALAEAFQWSMSVLLIMPQSILLGMTFPLMSAGILRIFPHSPGRTISLLYFCNGIGGTAGVLVSGFALLPSVGLPGTIRLAGLINVVLGALVWKLAKKHSAASQQIIPVKASDPYFFRKFLLFLFVSMTTGASSFIYEIGWIRMLSLVMGSSTHAFELMLSAFILGIAFGGFWIQKRLDRHADPVRFLGNVQVLMGLLALSTLPLYGRSFGVMEWLIKTLSKTDGGYLLFNLSSFAIAASIMLPATFCAGMTLPLITYILISRGHGEASIGKVYAANTLGAVGGVFFALHIGMPLLGLKWLITFGAVLDILLGLLLLWRVAFKHRVWRMAAAATASCLVAVMAMAAVDLDPYKMASGVFRYGNILKPESNLLLFHKDGKTATVSVIVSRDGNMSILTNGKPDAAINMLPGREPDSDEPTMILAAAIPMALNPGAVTAANIGLGSGLSTQTLLGNDMLKEVDTVEIESAVTEGSNAFRPRVERVYTDARSRIYIDDARSFFSVNDHRYDIIVSEPSNPWVSGVSGLFTREFYQLVHRHLNRGGLFVQWVQLYETNMDLVASVFKTVSSTFSDYVVYLSNNSDMIIVASASGRIGPISQAIFDKPEIAEALKRIDIRSVQDIEFRKVGSKQTFDKLAGTFDVHENSDYYPVLDQNGVRARFLMTDAQDLIHYYLYPLPTTELLSESGFSRHDSNITLSFFSRKTRAASEAIALRDYMLHGDFGDFGHDMDPAVRQHAVDFKRLFYQCDSVPDHEVRIAGIFNTAHKLTSILSPSEMENIWNSLEAGHCENHFTPAERTWLSLFKAIGRRDTLTMARTARELLETEAAMPPSVSKYLVASGMLGSLIQDDKAGAQRLWQTHGLKLFENGKIDLFFLWLAAECEAK